VNLALVVACDRWRRRAFTACYICALVFGCNSGTSHFTGFTGIRTSNITRYQYEQRGNNVTFLLLVVLVLSLLLPVLVVLLVLLVALVVAALPVNRYNRVYI
jgi:NO-binding membrane sensor protein with MHYT domain